jgi:hypothetical protein
MPSLNTKLASAPNTTANYVLKATTSTTIGNSLIFDNGTQLGFGTATPNTAFNFVASYAGHLSSIQNNNAGYYSSLDIYDSTGAERIILGYGNASVTNALAGKAFLFTPSGVDMNFYTGGINQRMIITSTGNVGIGTTSPQRKFHISGSVSGVFDAMLVENTTSSSYSLYQCKTGSSQTWQWGVWNDNNYRLGISGLADFLSVTSGGILLVGGITSTSAYLDGYLSVAVPSGTAPASCFKNLNSGQFVSSFWNADTSGDNIFVRFVSDSGASIRGTIFYSRANGIARFDGQASGTYSDERLKNIKGEMGYGLDTINKIKTYDFIWKRNGNKGFGVKAQEISELIPEIVEKGSDGEIDPMEFETTDIWKVNYNELVPVLIKAIQELKAEVDSLKQLVK